MKVEIPAPPTSSFEPIAPSRPVATRKRLKLSAPLDVGFLTRTHVTSLWVGTLGAMIAYGQSGSLKLMGSFIGGVALGALLLKTQEIFVRRVMSSSVAMAAGSFGRFGLLLIWGAKFGVLMILMGIAMGQGWLHPGAFVLGFFTQQLIVVAKAVGRFLSLKMRSDDDNRSESSKSKSNFNPNLKHGA